MHRIDIAKKYYNFIREKKAGEIERYLDENVKFIGPMDDFSGKKELVAATTNFAKAFESLKIRKAFESEDEAVIVYDVVFPKIEKPLRGVSILTFRGDKIVQVELFYDAALMHSLKKQIFSDK